MIRTSLVLPEALHQRLVTYAKEEKKSITKLVQELLVKALATKEQVRIRRMYQDLSELENLGPRGVKDASTTINQTLYGDEGSIEKQG
jgi:NADH/NAD ratio-sensing transcriptional regulator Rex